MAPRLYGASTMGRRYPLLSRDHLGLESQAVEQLSVPFRKTFFISETGRIICRRLLNRNRKKKSRFTGNRQSSK